MYVPISFPEWSFNMQIIMELLFLVRPIQYLWILQFYFLKQTSHTIYTVTI